MNAKRIGVVAVAAIAMAIVVHKRAGTDPESAASSTSASGASPRAPSGSVVLVADLGEADAPCVCGKIIRSVRSAALRGVPVTEIDPARAADRAAQYGVRVSPTVIVLDASGKETRRLEGESKEAYAALVSELDRLPGKGP